MLGLGAISASLVAALASGEPTGVAAGAMPPPPAATAAPAQDPVTRARQLAGSGGRPQAIALLEARLGERSTDGDARVLLGTILSWEGRYDEARAHLERVLERSPGHYDAVRALANLELWSDHPDRTERITADALRRDSGASDLRLTRARALRALGRHAETRDELDRLLAREPGNAPARALSESLEEELRVWEAGSSYGYDGFSDGRTAWHETSLSIKRRTRLGTAILRGNHAWRWDEQETQAELDLYPRIRPGTYGFVSGGWSPARSIYPSWRVAADIYQSLGRGFEASLGFRRLEFSSGVNIFVATLGKYIGSWYIVGRSFVTPDGSGLPASLEGVSVSFHLGARRYLGDNGSYVGLRYGHGFAQEELRDASDFTLLQSDTVAADGELWLGRVGVAARAGVSRGELAVRDPLTQYSASVSLAVRF